MRRMKDESDPRRIRARREYYANPAFCLHCKEIIQLTGVRPSDRRRQLFCSRSCAAKTNNVKHPKRICAPRTCRICTARPATSKSIYCSEHRGSRNSKPTAIYITVQDIIDAYKGKGYAPGIAMTHVRSRARRVLKGGGRTKCERLDCGYDNHVEAAHILSISSFPRNTAISTINAPSNIAALCPNHHWEFDNGLLALSMIKSPSILSAPVA